MPTNNQQIKLRDGRLLGYAEFGDPDGKPILYFHGAHSSRVSGKVLAPVATRINARVIAVDRPGFGLSDFKSGHPIRSNRFRNDFLLEHPGSTGNRIRTATRAGSLENQSHQAQKGERTSTIAAIHASWNKRETTGGDHMISSLD